LVDVRIIRTIVARVPDAVSVPVFLTRVVNERAIITGVTVSIVVAVRLKRVIGVDAIVLAIWDCVIVVIKDAAPQIANFVMLAVVKAGRALLRHICLKAAGVLWS